MMRSEDIAAEIATLEVERARHGFGMLEVRELIAFVAHCHRARIAG